MIQYHALFLLKRKGNIIDSDSRKNITAYGAIPPKSRNNNYNSVIKLLSTEKLKRSINSKFKKYMVQALIIEQTYKIMYV